MENDALLVNLSFRILKYLPLGQMELLLAGDCAHARNSCA